MLFRFGSVHRSLGWLLTLLGLVALAVGGRGYWTGAAVRPALMVGGLIGIVAGTAIVRWSRRARGD
jgi:predicted ABC-type sugar transport system permease subunit